jgi:hypothetical protein
MLTVYSFHSFAGNRFIPAAQMWAQTPGSLLVDLDIGGWRENKGPYINDFLLHRVRDRNDYKQEMNPLEVIHNHQCYPSPWREDQARIHAVLSDEINSGFLEGRLEWFLNELLLKTSYTTVIFVAPPGMWGLSAALISMGLRLPQKVHLAPGMPQESPPMLFAIDISWNLIGVGPNITEAEKYGFPDFQSSGFGI